MARATLISREWCETTTAGPPPQACDPLKSSPAKAGPAGPATPPLIHMYVNAFWTKQSVRNIVDGHFFRVVHKVGFHYASGALLVQCGPVRVLKKASVLSIQPQLTQYALSVASPSRLLCFCCLDAQVSAFCDLVPRPHPLLYILLFVHHFHSTLV